jgi:GH24 family phage-related lysozyme (muramidase)
MAANSPQPAPPPSSGNAKRGGIIAAGLLLLAAIIGGTPQDAGNVVGDIQQHESSIRFHPDAYQDSVGIWTICDGIIRWEDGPPVKKGDKATPERCQSLLIHEVLPRARRLVACIPSLYRRTNQIRALIDLSYNAGVEGICSGTIGKDIRAGDWAGASLAIMPWDRGTFARFQPGRDCRPKPHHRWLCRIPGLTNRRIANKVRFDINRPAQGVKA